MTRVVRALMSRLMHRLSSKSVRGPRRWPALLAFAVLGLTLATPEVARAAPETVYTVAKVAVDTTAADAVAAKEKAMRLAEIRAAQILLKRLAPFASDRVPELKGSLVEDMLDGVSVRSERYSGTRYIASLDVSFRREAVRQVLRSYGLQANERQAEELKVLPLVLTVDGIKAETKEGWRQAWNGLDLTHSMAPVEILELKAALSGDQLTKILNGDAEALSKLRSDYRADRLVLAVAAPVEKGSSFATRLFGADAVGAIDLSRTDRIYGGNVKDAARRAAAISLGVIEGRWKLMQGVAESGDAAARAAGGSVNALVEFSGMRQWQSIRSRLMRMPGMRGIDVGTLTARSASVVFAYDGGRQQLSQELERQGFALYDHGDMLVVNAN